MERQTQRGVGGGNPTGRTSEKTNSINRFIWLLEEAARRVKEEKLRYFTDGLLPLQFEMDDTRKELEINSPPFRLEREMIAATDKRSDHWAEITKFSLSDPTGKSGHYVFLCGERWTDKKTNTVRSVAMEDHELTDLRQRTLNTLRRWIDWLKAEQTTLEPVDEEVTTGQDVKPEISVVSIDTICLRICPQRNGRKTLKRILELSKQGDSPSDIAKKNAGRRGFSLPNISEQLTKVRDQFPDFLP